MKKEYITAQNQHTLGFGEQILHIKRFWVFLITFFVYSISGSYLVSSLAFLLLFYASVKLHILTVREKDGLLYFLIPFYIARGVSYVSERLVKLLNRVMHMVLLLSLPVMAQVIEPPPVQQNQNLPPPPPPPPEPSTITVEPMTSREVEALLRRENIKNFILDGQFHLAPGGHARMPLRENNVVYFHETMPVLLVFDKEIRDVFLLSSISAFYDERSVFVLGPSQVYAGFAVSFKDGEYAYFTMIKKTDFSTKAYHGEDEKLKNFLDSGKNFPQAPVRKLATFYYFYTPKKEPLHAVVEHYLRSRTTCPREEHFTYGGVLYKVKMIGKEGVMRDEGDFYACGYYWRISK